MDSDRSRAGNGIANSETSGWKSVKFHALIVWEIAYAIVVSSPPNVICNMPEVIAWVEELEKKLYTSAKDKDDYYLNMARWIMSIDTSSRIPGRKPLATFSNLGETASFLSGENEGDAYIYWLLVIYYKVQRMSSVFFSRFPNWCRLAFTLLEQLPPPQNLKIAHIMKCNIVIRLLENIVLRLHVSRGQISPDFKEKLDGLEKLIVSVLRPRNVPSSHHQEPSSSSSAHRHSIEQSVPSQSEVSQENLSELPLMNPQSSHVSKRKSDDLEQEKPKKLMKQEARESIISLKDETPGEASKEDDDDDGLDLSLKL